MRRAVLLLLALAGCGTLTDEEAALMSRRCPDTVSTGDWAIPATFICLGDIRRQAGQWIDMTGSLKGRLIGIMRNTAKQKEDRWARAAEGSTRREYFPPQHTTGGLASQTVGSGGSSLVDKAMRDLEKEGRVALTSEGKWVFIK